MNLYLHKQISKFMEFLFLIRGFTFVAHAKLNVVGSDIEHDNLRQAIMLSIVNR